MTENHPLQNHSPVNNELREFVYRVIRYTPNLVRDEWVNIGVILEEAAGTESANATLTKDKPPRRQARLIEENAELARVRRMHPAADDAVLRGLGAFFDARLAETDLHGVADTGGGIRKLDDSLSTALQFSPQKGVLAEDFDVELERLYQAYVSPPRGARAGLLENTRAWIRARLSDVFRRRGILGKMEKALRVEEFTQPGDPLRLDYGYRSNGTRGFLHAISIARDPAQAKVLAYTAECIRARVPKTEFTAVVELEPARENPRHQFVARLFEEQHIALVPLNRIEKFAEELRVRVN
jgi:Protein of unknown function (DUF3037)